VGILIKLSNNNLKLSRNLVLLMGVFYNLNNLIE